jgi:Tol biopolymer transport system component
LSRKLKLSILSAVLLGGALFLPWSPVAAQYNEPNFGKNKIQYRQFDWKIYRSPHFNVHYYTDEETRLQTVVSLAESAYDHLSREFNFQIKDPIPLLFFATHSQFEQNNVILNFIPEGVGAFASPIRFRMVMPVDVPDAELYQLISHELTHIFQYYMLFQGSLTKGVATSPPTWFMEGMASYMAKDESPRDQMFLRDAVVNDNIPPVTQVDIGGFFAYRFGHAVFDFIEERWGKDGFLDFIYEVRNTITSQIGRAVKRTFKIEPEDFDLEFRRWLRKKYLPQLIETGEPGDFGRVFRVKDSPNAESISPVASPSGDLVAAFSIYRGDLDVVLFDAQKRTFVRSLTKGFTNKYQYLVAQELALGRKTGRDLSFSPDGNTIAVFAHRERGRSLLLLDVLKGGIRDIIDMPDIEQQLSPAFSPDGKKVAFSGYKGGHFDLFLLDLASREITPLTNDEIYDGAPAFSPDGKSLAFISVVGTEGHNKIFRMDLAHPGQRYAVLPGPSNENDPVYSPDGKRIYFTSDRKDAKENIFSIDLASGEAREYTNVVSGAFMPTLLREPTGTERLVFTGYWKGKFDLFVTDVDQPIGKSETVAVPAEPATTKELPRFEPDIQVSIDDANKSKYRGFKFFLEDAQSFIGVDSSNTYVGRVVLNFSDYLGNRRILANLSSIDSFSNFDLLYIDLTHRTQWQVELFDNRSFYVAEDTLRGTLQRGRTAYQVTGAVASLVYPLNFYHRAEIGAGYVFRKANLQGFVIDNATGDLTPVLVSISDSFPVIQGALVGDTAVYAEYGGVAGRRWRLNANYAPNLQKGGGAVTSGVDLDFRQYLPITRRSNLAMRVFAGASSGNNPSPYYFGGLDTLRGSDLYSFAGDRAFFANLEYRFPLIDLLATPVVHFQGIRGNVFVDVGGAWYHNAQPFRFYDSDSGTLRDAVAAYGFGLTVQLFGLDLNWDFAKRWNLKESQGRQTSFWIGARF